MSSLAGDDRRLMPEFSLDCAFYGGEEGKEDAVELDPALPPAPTQVRSVPLSIGR